MKLFITFFCILAVTSETFSLTTFYTGPQHIPIIDHEGVPVNTPEVLQARAAHFAQKSNIEARNTDISITISTDPNHNAHPDHHKHPTHHANPAQHHHSGNHGHPIHHKKPIHHGHQSHHNHPAHHTYLASTTTPGFVNVPLYPPELAAVKAAYGETLARYRRGIYLQGLEEYNTLPYDHSYGFPHSYMHHF